MAPIKLVFLSKEELLILAVIFFVLYLNIFNIYR